MKLVGVMLILFGAGLGYLKYRRDVLYTLGLTRSLADGLAVLRCGICVHRRSLPTILNGELQQGAAASAFWIPLAQRLASDGKSIRQCWVETAADLPKPLNELLSPLGALIPVGGDMFSCAANELREELLSAFHRQQETQNTKLRLTAAVCFSVAALFILVFI